MTGCPIPDSGDPVVVPLCLPDGWQSLVSELLTFPTRLDFWDNLATLEDIEVARRTAFDIVGKFNSSECDCDPPCPSGNYYAFDFEASYGGWSVPSGGYGEYISSVGWRTVIVDLPDGRHSKLDITIADFPAWLTVFETVNAVISLSGTGSAIPVRINMTAYSWTLGTTHNLLLDQQMSAIGTNTQLYLKPTFNVRNVCHSQTSEYHYAVDIGPYDSTFQAASFTLADIRFWVRLP